MSKPLTAAVFLVSLSACHGGEEQMTEENTGPIGAWAYFDASGSEAGGAVYFHKNDHVMDDEDLQVFGPYGAYRWSPVEPRLVDISFADAPAVQVKIEPLETSEIADVTYFSWNDGADGAVLKRVKSCILECQPE